MNINKPYPSGRIALIALLTLTAIAFFLRCYYRVPSGDELLYEYVWEKDDSTDLWTPGHEFNRKVSSLSDIIESQVQHYKYANGRSIVHSIEQAFTGHTLLFSILNTAIFLLFTWLIAYYVTLGGDRYRSCFLLWLIIFIALLNLFPLRDSLWVSVNYGLNYLWPATMATGVMVLWDRLAKGELSARWNIPMALLGLIFGWSHEGFVVGVSGGMFLYYCFHIRQFRGQAPVLAVPMWISACVMVFAPGNINRFFHHDDATDEASMLMKLLNGFDNLLHLWMIWILAIGVIILLAAGKKDAIKVFIRDNSRLLWVFAISFIFSMIANTAPHSHTFVELTSLYIILRYVTSRKLPHLTRTVKIGIYLLGVLFTGHQLLIARDTWRNYEFQTEVVNEYIDSPDGIVHFTPINLYSITKPYIRIWKSSGAFKFFFFNVYNEVLFNGNKPPLLLEGSDYEAVTAPQNFFTAKNKLPGNAPCYIGEDGKFIWIKPDALSADEKLTGMLYPVDWDHDVQVIVKLKFLLTPGSYPGTERLEIDTINSRWGRAMRIKPLPVRKIKAVDIATRQ